MTTLPKPRRSHLIRRDPAIRKFRIARFIAPAGLIALPLAVIVGCAVKSTAPVETVFNDPVEITLPTDELNEVRDAANEAEFASNETIKAVDGISSENIGQSLPEAKKWSRATHDAIRKIFDPLADARSMNEIAADRIIEATNQTNDARDRLKLSEKTRETERKAAKEKIEKLEKRIEELKSVRGQWLGYSIAGLGVLCLALGAIGLIGQKFIKLSFGAGVVGIGLIGIGMAVVNYAIWVSIIGVAVFVAFIIGGTIYFVRKAKRDDDEIDEAREAGKTIAKSVQAAVVAVDDFNLTDKVKKTMKAVQSTSPLAESLVDEAQREMGLKPVESVKK